MLDTTSWQGFKIGDFFEIRPTKTYKGLAADDLNDGGQTPFVVNSSANNGIGGLSTLPPTEEGGMITFSDTTDGNTFFYQPSPFIGFSHVQGMYANDRHHWTQEELLFLTTVLTFDSVGRYNYGRKMTRETIRSRDVLLPVALDGEPDWQFMEDFIKGINHKPLTTENRDDAVLNLDTVELVNFNFGRLASDVYRATAFTKDDLVEVPYTDLKAGGYARYITRTALNNGCEMLVARDKALEGDVEAGNAISIGDTTATCFYQPEEFVAGDHMVVVRAEWLNPFTGNFIATLLNRESYRYSYGRAFVMKSIRATDLKLPIKRNSDGTPTVDPKKSFHDDGYIPDWQFMEDYMRSLPYGDRVPELSTTRP